MLDLYPSAHRIFLADHNSLIVPQGDRQIPPPDKEGKLQDARGTEVLALSELD